MSDDALRLGHILLPVDDMEGALGFYTGVLGLPLRFRDGDRYAALDVGGGTLALLDPSEQAAPGEVAIGLKVRDVEAVHGSLVGAGVEIVRPLADTAHERSFAFRAPNGTVLVVYSSLPA